MQFPNNSFWFYRANSLFFFYLNLIMGNYTQQEIDDICEEIERQWRYYLMVRAVFPNQVENAVPSWTSMNRDFYREREIIFRVETPANLPKIMKLGLSGTPHWLNQNYIIRLCGILDEKQITGFANKNEFIELVRLLRNSVGTHSRGYRNPKRPSSKKAADIITRHLDPLKKEMTNDDRAFLLSIEILEEIKEKCKSFVKTLVDQEKPHTDKVNKILKDISSLTEEKRGQLFEFLKASYPQDLQKS